MKLQILHLDPHDDHISARDKLGRAKADRVLLVWPDSGSALQRRLDLALIHREAAKRGQQLGFLTFDPLVRDRAHRLGIPTFESLDDLPEERWSDYRPPQGPSTPPALGERGRLHDLPRGPGRGARRKLNPWIRLPLIGLAFLSLLSLAVALVPRATLTVRPKTEERSADLGFPLVPIEAAAGTDGAIESEVISTAVTVSPRVPTTGRASVPATHAAGSLRFTNLTADALEIPAGTSARTVTDPLVRAVTLEAVALPPERGAAVEVPARAAEPGEAGNLPAGAIEAVDGVLGLSVQVTNPSPMSGGSSVLEPAVADRDLAALHRAAQVQVLAEGLTQLADLVEPGSHLAEASVARAEILAEEMDAEVGDLASSVGMTMTARVTGLAFSGQSAAEAVRIYLSRREGSNDTRRVVPNSIDIELINSTVEGEDTVRVELTSHWEVYSPPDEWSLRSSAAGLAPEEVTTLAADFQLESVGVEWWPAWSPRLPLLPSQISVRYGWGGD